MSRSTNLVLASVGALLVLFAVSAAKPGLPPHTKADETGYYLAALSLIHDGDLRCESHDMARYWAEFYAPPDNVILMSSDGWRTVYFGKPYVYPMLAVPFVALFGASGMAALNMLLLVAMIWMGARYLSLFNGPGTSLALAMGFFILSNGFSYVFWMHPEVLSMASVMTCLYLVFGKEGKRPRIAHWTPYLSGAVLAIATYQKPMYGIIGGAAMFAAWRGFGRGGAVRWVAGAVIGAALLAAGSLALTGSPTAYLGVSRYGVNVRNPLHQYVTIEELGAAPRTTTRFTEAAATKAGETPEEQVNDGSWYWFFTKRDIRPPLLPYEFWSFLVGRHTGVAPYQPFAVLCLLLFLISSRRSLTRWLLLGSLFVTAWVFLLFLAHNWHGGSGNIGNRYWISLYPASLFLVTRIRPGWLVLPTFVAGGLFATPLIFTVLGPVVPYGTLQAHARNPAYRAMPRELSIIRTTIPGYLGASHGWVYFSGSKEQFRDAGDEMWIHGGTTVDILMEKGEVPIDTPVLFRVRNLMPGNTIELELEGDREVLSFDDDPHAVRMVELHPQRTWKIRQERDGRYQDALRHSYRLRVRSTGGARPSWYGQGGISDFYLGAALLFLGTEEDRERDLYAHRLAQDGDVPYRVDAGSTFWAPVSITNLSEHTWPAGGALSVRLSYHWLDEAGHDVQRDGRRTRLPKDVAPGATEQVVVAVDAPTVPGSYVLELDPVYEYVSWFSAHASESARSVRLEVEVEAAVEADAAE